MGNYNNPFSVFDMPNTWITIKTKGCSMIIRHSLQLLEQLSEIEALIKQLEKLMNENEIDFDKEKEILKILNGRRKFRPLKSKT